jgi:hypothetical protein
VLAWKADVVSSMATAVVLALCTVPVGWIVRQLVGEVALRRLYDRPARDLAGARKVMIERRMPLALPPVPPLAAGRFVIDAEAQQ